MATKKAEAPAGAGYNFGDYKKDMLTKPRDLAWSNWMTWKKVGDKVQGHIRDVFYRPAEGKYKDQRGITLEQVGGELINVGIKTLPFVMIKTDDLKIGDPLTIVLEEQKPNKGLSPTNIFAFYGTNLPENAANKTVRQLYDEDFAKGGSVAAAPEEDEKDRELDELSGEGKTEKVPF